MKRLLFFGFLLLSLAPFSVFAESGTRYGTAADCKENVQAKGTFLYPSGIALDESGNPKLQIIVDPKFNDKMKKERFTPDLPVTPVYDLIVEAVPAFSSCYTETPEKFSTEPPKTLPFPVSIKLEGKTLVGPGTLTLSSRKSDDGKMLYEWKLKGWPNGIVSESKMEKLIKAIAEQNPTLKTVVEIRRKDGASDPASTGAEFMLCAPVWGSGEHRVVYDRVAHRLSDFTYQADSIITGAFLKVDPFKVYQKEFSHFFNLRNYQGKSWFNIHEAAAEGILPLAQDCGNNKAIHISISPLVALDNSASALASGRFIQIASDVTKRTLDYNDRAASRFFVITPFPLIALHEFGHAFANLNDEYISGEVHGPNCSSNPATDWSYNDIQYGDSTFEGCGYPTVYHRPSQQSIMRGARSGETRFNVVSCVYIIDAIKGDTNREFGPKSGPGYWQECMNPAWNTIKPTGKTALFGLNLASIFQSLALAPSNAPVGATKESGQNIYVDYMSEDGTFTGEVISVPSVSYVSPPLVEVDMVEDDFVATSTEGIRYGTAADCKENVQAKGTFLYPSGIATDDRGEPKLQIIVDPKFNDKMKAERGTPDLPVTPIYDLVVQAIPAFSSCYTDTPEKFSTEPPKTLPFKVSVVADGQPIVDSGTLTQSDRKDDNGRIIYEWKLKGWPSGIADATKTELLIKAVQEGKPIKIVVDGIKQSDNTLGKEEQKTSFGLCAPIWGSGEHKVTFMRGASSILHGKNAISLVIDSKSYEENGFAVVEPFKRYERYFSLSVDLLRHEDSMLLQQIASKKWYQLEQQTMSGLLSQSSCAPAGIGVFHTGEAVFSNGLKPQGFAPIGTRNKKPETKFVIFANFGSALTVLHELGHIFGLGDEASYKDNKVDTRSSAPSVNWLGVQCSINPNQDYFFGGKKYGANVYGCGYGRVKGGMNSQGQKYDHVFRPSETSIMNYGLTRTPEFNVVSCGWIIAAIKGGDAKSYFPECAKMDGVIKDGVTAQNVFSPMFAWIGTIFSPPSSSLTAQVGSATPSNQQSSYLIVESFDPNNPWGEIVPIAPDDETPTVTPSPSDTSFPPAEAAPYVRYCPDATQIFTGIAHETEYTPKITVKVDPKFNDKMKAERSMGDLPLTPVYDLVVTVVPTINEYCLPQYDENGAKIREVDPPQLLPFNTSLVIGNTATADSTLVVGVLKRAGKNPGTGEWRYEWKATGWPNGIADGAKMEKLVDAIAKNQPVNVIVEVKRPGKDTVYEKSPVSFGLCAPLSGSGEHRVVYMRGKSSVASFSVSTLREYIEDDIVQGFGQIEPFAKYSGYFSHFFDLQPHDDSWYIRRMRLLKTNDRTENLLSPIPSLSACTGGKLHIMHSDTDLRTAQGSFDGIASFGKGIVLLKANSPYRVVIHETAHAFAKLLDEYLQSEVLVSLPAETNCSTDPARDYAFDGKRYGRLDKIICGGRFLAPAGTRSGDRVDARKLQLIFRPADGGMMNNPPRDGFNSVACGWIIAAIKGGDAKSYFPECAKMDGIIKDGVTAQNVFSPMFALLQNPLSYLPLGKGGEEGEKNALLAAVGEAQVAAGAKVKAKISYAYGSVPEKLQMTELPKNAKILGPAACGASEALQLSATQLTECYNKIMAVQVRETQIADLDVANKILEERLQLERDTHSVFTNIDDSPSRSLADIIRDVAQRSFLVIPIGEPAEKMHAGADFSSQCIAYSDGRKEGPFPVGTVKSDFATGGVYNHFGPKTLKEITDALSTLLHIQKLKNESTNWLVKWANKGVGAIQSLGDVISGGGIEELENSLKMTSAKFMFVDADAFSKVSAETKKALEPYTATLSVSLGKDKCEAEESRRFVGKKEVKLTGVGTLSADNKRTLTVRYSDGREEAVDEKLITFKTIKVESETQVSTVISLKLGNKTYTFNKCVNPREIKQTTINDLADKISSLSFTKGIIADEIPRLREEIAQEKKTAPQCFGLAPSGTETVKLVIPGLVIPDSDGVATLQSDSQVEQSSQPVRKSGVTPAERRAAAGTAIVPNLPPTGSVRIKIPDNLQPPAEFEPLAPGEQIVNPALCAQDIIDRYFGGSTGQYLLHLNPKSKCAAQLTEATDLIHRLSALTEALAPFAMLEKSLENTIRAFAARRSIDGLTLVLIPAPQIIQVPYRTVSEVGMTCIKDQNGNIRDAAVPAGSISSSYTVAGVQSVTAAQRAQMAEIKKTSREGIADVMKVINKGKKVGLNDSLELSDRLGALFGAAQNMFTILTPEEFQKNYSALSEADVLRVSFTATPSAACAFPWLEGNIARKKYGVAKDTPFIPVSVTVDNATLTNFCIPETVFLSNLVKGVKASQTQIARYSAQLTADAPMQKLRLQTLEEGGYGCSDASASVESVGEKKGQQDISKSPVRKSGVTPSERRAAADADAEAAAPSGGAPPSSSEPSYLIIESFDPNNPWGEIVEVVSDDSTRSDLVENNLSATKPTISGSSAGSANTLSAGKMTLRATIQSEGGEIRQTFGNTIQYRDVKTEGSWTDWVKFQVSGLNSGGRANVAHTWKGGAGEWEFRIIADSGNAVAESDEEDNTSAAVRVEVVPSENAPPPKKETQVGGAPKLRLSTPVISGKQTGFGKLFAGTMTVTGKAVNIGDGDAPPFQLLFLYSQDGQNWNDWVRIDSQTLSSGAERSVVYSWEGGTGGWYIKICEDITDSCSPAVFFEVVPL